MNDDAGTQGRLVALIDEYRDKHGQPPDASIARAIGVAPQTISSWRRRGIREMPNPETLRSLAAFLKVDESVTFYAAGVDAGYIIERLAEDQPVSDVG